jgi:putative ABC transport system substrate-binding protein
MSDTVPKHLQLMQDVVPTMTAVAVVWSPANPGHTFAFRDVERASASLGIKVVSAPMTQGGDLAPALDTIKRARPDALIVQPGPFITTQVERLAELCEGLRIPSISIMRQFAERGLLMSYGADFREAPRRVAAYVDRILSGARPADLPVERPGKFDLVINLKAARALGLAIPQSVLLQADDFI